MSGSTLSPWDLSGLGMGFGLYRPRRPSYTFATQHSRQRSESYRYATRRDPDSAEAQPQEDYIENVLSKVRKESYIKATRDELEGNHVELSRLTENHMTIVEEGSGNDALCESQNHINQKFAAQNCKAKSQSRQTSVDTLDAKERLSTTAGTPSGGEPTPSIVSSYGRVGWCSGQKNLIVLCISFILIFSPFRGVQNLQSSLNAEDQLGIIAMSCLHGTMVMTCFLAPLWTNIFTAKWTLALGALCFLLWFGANFYPTFYTLIPAAVVTGFGHGLLWTAESSYLLKLAFDLANITRDQLEPKMFRFHAIFLACFQTTHIWGNLISSLLLGHRTQIVRRQTELDFEAQAALFNMTVQQLKDAMQSSTTQCGVLYRCRPNEYIPVFPDKPYDREDMRPVLWQLMCGYIVLAFLGFCLILVLLDRIGARADPESTGIQMLKQHVSQLVQHRTFRLLSPLMVFSGLQQGFMFTDYNLVRPATGGTFVLGAEYVGFCMITLGVANVGGSVVVALVLNKVPREVVLGFGGIMHMALMIGFLIWIPDKHPMLFFVLAAAWGVCDAVWQTQCNSEWL
ncbi:hypothetical protein ACOMHN_015405 [Nucella lapillus]